jgi:serine/threonine-protein kinase
MDADETDTIATPTGARAGEEPPVRPGSLLDRDYRVERVLGEGGMGIVVAARDIRSEELVAIKLIRPERASNPQAVKRFLREARITLQLKSARTVRVLRLGQLASGLPYLVMEYLDGGTVASLLRERGALPVETAVDYLLQACEAVAEAHALGIVHRDLKPSNLFLACSPEGAAPAVKVIDFGISKWTGSQPQIEDGQLTTTAVPLGSPRYMSPEQLGASRVVDARADIWALGVILYELVTATHPFAADSVTELCARILRDPAPPLPLPAVAGAAALDAVYRRCLAKDPAQRIPTVADLAVALAPHGSAAARASATRILATVPDAATTVAPPLGGGGERRRAWPRGVAVLLAASGLAAGLYTLGPRRSGRREEAGRSPAAAQPSQPSPAAAAAASPTTRPSVPPPASPPPPPASRPARPARERHNHRDTPPAPQQPAPDEDLFRTRQ